MKYKTIITSSKIDKAIKFAGEHMKKEYTLINEDLDKRSYVTKKEVIIAPIDLVDEVITHYNKKDIKFIFVLIKAKKEKVQLNYKPSVIHLI